MTDRTDATARHAAHLRELSPERLAELTRQYQGAADPSAAVERRRARWYETLSAAGVPPLYADVPVGLKIGEAAAWRGEPWCATFLGINGCGKTWAATWLFGQILCEGISGLWVNAAEAIDQMRREINTPRDGETFNRLKRTPLLLVDELLKDRQDTNFGPDKWSMLFEHRYCWRRWTILTTNSMRADGADGGLDTLAALYPSVASRLQEPSGKVVLLPRKDRRRR